MNIKTIIKRNRDESPAQWQKGSDVFSLQDDINRLFDEFFGDTGLSPVRLEPVRLMEDHLTRFSPRIDVRETDQEINVTAELPGLDEKDVSVSLEEHALIISGEKKEEQEQKTAHSYHMERSFGTFRRVIPLRAQVEPAKIKAVFKKGVLQVTLPKAPEEKENSRKIEIRTE